MIFSRIALFISHLIGNALLLWLGYRWLGMDESDRPHLLWSVAIVVALVGGTLWLHGMAFAQFSGLRYFRAAARAVRNLMPLFTLALLGIAIYAVLLWTASVYHYPAYVIGSWLTMTLHKPVPSKSVENVFHAVLLFLEWIVVPSLLFPMAAAVTARGWRGLRIQRRSGHTWLYWIATGVLLFCAIWVPVKLFFWVPEIKTFSGQMISFALRVGAGYLLFVFGLLILDFLTSAGNPRDTQLSTAESPY